MNREEIESRIATITAEMAQMRATYAKLEGHLGEAQHWLQELDKKESEPEGEHENGEAH